MKTKHNLTIAVSALAFALVSEPDASPASGLHAVKAYQEADEDVAPARDAPVYTPPKRGRPRARVGGGVRSNGAKLPTLRALVPDHVALTAREQPLLLWSVSEIPPTDVAVLFTLTSEDEIDPLIRAEIERPGQPGLQRIDLATFDFRLEAGKEYEWSVALVPDRDSRARDLVTLGWIERVDGVAQGWIERIDESTDASNASLDAAKLAEAGLWYDAVVVADPEERAALLDQVGLPAIGL